MAAPLILARTFKDAHSYAQNELGLSIGYYRVVNSPGTIKAVRGTVLHLVPGWDKRPDRFSMKSAIRYCRNTIVDASIPAEPEPVLTHFIAGGAILHAVADTSDIQGVDTPEDVTCSICTESLERDGLPKVGPTERDIEVAYRYNTLLDTSDGDNMVSEGGPVEPAVPTPAEVFEGASASVEIKTDAIPEPVEAPKAKRRSRCKDCGNLHYKDEPCPEGE